MKNANAILKIANAFYYRSIKIKSKYLDDVKCYDTEITDTPGDDEQARKNINKWISEKTMEKIPELLKPGIIHAYTRAVLANALYLKAGWLQIFPEIIRGMFYRYGKADDAQQVLFAKQTAKFDTWEAHNYQAIALPYIGEELEMILIQPLSTEDDYKKHKDAAKLLHQNTERKKKYVELRMPKFCIRSQMDLKSLLGELGFNLIPGVQKETPIFKSQ